MTTNQHEIVRLQKPDANVLARQLNAEELDGWTYVAEHNMELGYSCVKVYDENGHYLGTV